MHHSDFWGICSGANVYLSLSKVVQISLNMPFLRKVHFDPL